MRASSVDRVLVTGATGFIASHVIAELLRQGAFVRGTVRSVSSARNAFLAALPGAHERLQLVAAELDKPDGWDAAVTGCSVIHHIASPTPSEASKPTTEEMVRMAVFGVRHVFEAAARVGGVRHVVMTSSSAAVGEGQEALRTSGHVFTDADWSDPSKVDGGFAPYITSKFQAEQYAWNFVKAHPAGFTLT